MGWGSRCSEVCSADRSSPARAQACRVPFLGVRPTTARLCPPPPTSNPRSRTKPARSQPLCRARTSATRPRAADHALRMLPSASDVGVQSPAEAPLMCELVALLVDVLAATLWRWLMPSTAGEGAAPSSAISSPSHPSPEDSASNRGLVSTTPPGSGEGAAGEPNGASMAAAALSAAASSAPAVDGDLAGSSPWSAPAALPWRQSAIMASHTPWLCAFTTAGDGRAVEAERRQERSGGRSGAEAGDGSVAGCRAVSGPRSPGALTRTALPCTHAASLTRRSASWARVARIISRHDCTSRPRSAGVPGRVEAAEACRWKGKEGGERGRGGVGVRVGRRGHGSAGRAACLL